MLKFLSYNHVITYSFLFLVLLGLRLPSFNSNYFGEDEAYYLTAAEKIADGGVQYVDTWDNKPPVIVWFYSFFVWLFGSGALTVIRIFTLLYLFGSALLINQVVNDFRLLDRFSLLPAFLYIIITSVPWYAQEMNGELLMSLPIILAFRHLILLRERGRENQIRMFNAGLLLGLSFMIKYQAVMLFLGFFIAYLIVQSPKVSESFSLISGFFLSVSGIILVVYFSGALPQFWDIGILYNLDYIFIGKNPGEVIRPWFNLGQYFQIWGVLFLMALLPIIHFRLQFFTYTKRLRRFELVTFIWFLAALVSVLAGGGRFYLHYFYLLAPPIAMYAAKFFELKMRSWLRPLVLVLALAIPFYTYSIYWVATFPKTFSFLYNRVTPGGWVDSFRKELESPFPLETVIDKEKVKNGILVMDYQPKLYARLDLPSATRYTNFSIAYFKFDFFAHNAGRTLISRKVSDVEVFEELEQARPEYILDPLNLFPELRERMPLLLAGYKELKLPSELRNYKIYYLE